MNIELRNIPLELQNSKLNLREIEWSFSLFD